MLAAAAACLASPLLGAQSLDAGQVARYGGSFAIDCADARYPRLRVTADALIIEHGQRRMTSSPIDNFASFYGPEPPPGYLTVLAAQVKGGKGSVMFALYTDATGRYVKIEEDGGFGDGFVRTLRDARHRDCDKPRARRDGGTFRDEQRQGGAADTALRATSPLNDARFKAAYDRALGPHAKERWIVELLTYQRDPQSVRLGGSDFQFYSLCKPHDCADNNMVLLYAREQGVAYGKLVDRRLPRWLGSPSAALRSEIERLWRAEWRR